MKNALRETTLRAPLLRCCAMEEPITPIRNRGLVEARRRGATLWILECTHKMYCNEQNTTSRTHMDRDTTIQATPDLRHMARSVVEHVVSTERAASMGKGKTRHFAARLFGGLYNIDSENQEFEAIVNNARTQLESQMESAMPCEAQKPSKRIASKNSTSSAWERPCAAPGHEGTCCETKIRKQFMIKRLKHMSLGETAFRKAENRDMMNALPTADTLL